MKERSSGRYALISMGFVCMAATYLSGAIIHLSPTGDDANDGSGWDKAKGSVAGAVAAAENNDTLLFTNGTYSITAWVEIKQGIALRSVNGPEVTIIDAGAAAGRRVMNVAHDDAWIEGLTLQRGRTTTSSQAGGLHLSKGVVTNCIISANKGYYYGGINMSGGLLTHSKIIDNHGNVNIADAGGIYLTGGTVVSCLISNNQSNAYGSGIRMTGGTVRDCKIVNNVKPTHVSGSGGGLYMSGGLVERTLISGNASPTTGGGVRQTGGTLRNCIIVNNRADGSGGGVYLSGSGTIEHCTISANTSQGSGTGVYLNGASATVKNSIICFNGIGYNECDGNIFHQSGTVSYTCSRPAVDGDGNIAGDPLFKDAANGDYTLFQDSPCIDTADPISGIDMDFNRQPRAKDGNGDGTALPDMGALERDWQESGNFRVTFSAAPYEALGALTANFTAYTEGDNAEAIWYGWDFNGDGTIDAAGNALRTVSQNYGQGFYTVSLLVSNTVGQAATFTRNDYIKVAPATNYVSLTGGDLPPYDSWATASKTIQAAVDAAWHTPSEKAVVLVDDGTYPITTALTLTADVIVKSANGPSAAILDGGNVVGRRVVHLNAPGAVLDGFTIKRGLIRNLGADGGAGIRLQSGTVTNCVITSCESYSYGGGVWISGGLLTHSRITGCKGTAAQSANTPVGGLYMTGGTVSDSVIDKNENSSDGPCGGVYITGGELLRCLIATNSTGKVGTGAPHGGGVRMTGGTVAYCRIIGNTSYGHGGGIYQTGGLLRNSLITGNKTADASKNGGGVCMANAAALMESCTVAGNESGGTGKGLYITAGEVINSIIYANNATPNVTQNGGTITYSCMTPLVGDATSGNIDGDPFFTDATAGDYTLSLGSAAVDRGINQEWMEDASDLAGTNRIINSTVDMGAFERPASSASELTCIFEATPNEGLTSLQAYFIPTVDGANTTIIFCRWDFGDGTFATSTTLESPSHSYAPGYYSVTLTITNELGQGATYLREEYIKVVPETAYVATDGSAIPPYLSWETAARSIQNAIDIGSRIVMVASGSYPIEEQLVVAREVALLSSSGPADTIITRVGDGRVLKVSHTAASVAGFTITKGILRDMNSGGTGLQLINGTVSNCVITGNSGYGNGAGAHITGGLLTGCVVAGNTAISAFASNGGGGIFQEGGTVTGCLIANNYAYLHGGGACLYDGTITHSIISNNYVKTASSASGGGIYQQNGLLRNVLIAHNGSAETMQGGGIRMLGGVVEFATVVCNQAAESGGGIACSGGAVTNSVIVLNTAPVGSNINSSDSFSHSISPDLIDGLNGNIQGIPQFRCIAESDFRHSGIYSPGVNAGAKLSWARQALDLNGGPRWIGAAPDMGAYESLSVAGTMLMLR